MNEVSPPSKLKTIFILVSMLIAIYAILGFSILPAVLSKQIPLIAKEQLNRDVHIKDIQFNPFSLETSIHGLQIDEIDSRAFVKFEKLYLNLAVLKSISSLSLVIDQVLLESPYVSVIRDTQANFNFSSLVPTDEQKEIQKTEETEEGEIFPITIALLSISKGKISWTDNIHSQGQREDIYPLNLKIDNFTTIINKQSDLGFSLKFASGGHFDWRGEIKLNPFESQGHIELNNINFHKVWKLFLQDSVNFTVLKGTELIKADYQFSSSEQLTQLLITKADISLLDIQLAEKDVNDVVISIPEFKVQGISFDLLEQNIEIENIDSKDAQFISWLTADGKINYQDLFASQDQALQSPTTATDVSNQSNSKPWNVLVKQLAINNYAFNFTDKTLASPKPINLSAINLTSEQLTNQQGASLPFNLALDFNETGNLAVKGHAVLEPLNSEVQLDIGNIALKDFQPYVSQFAKLDIISGFFNLKANIAVQQPKEMPLAITFKGDSHIDKLATRDQISNKDFVNWEKLSLKKIDLDLAANKYIIDTVKVEQPYARVLIRKDKSINLTDIMIEKSEDKKQSEVKQATEQKQTAEVDFKINHFLMTEGKSYFSDKSLILPFSAHINHLKGEVKGISSAKNAEIKVVLDGNVADISPVTIRGNILPSKGNSDFKVDFTSMPLPLMTPYMAEFAGRKIEKGNMSLNFKYKIRSNQLEASNNLLIDQLVLGDTVENPEAVSLPLGLAIALLQDSDGKINLDVPVTGDLDNPEFSVASLIFDALSNVLIKIVSSPFNAIASLIGSDEDMSIILFSAGESTLNKSQTEKLDGLAVALLERPVLKLEIEGAAYSKQDWPKMQLAALNKQILQLRIDELIKENSKQALPKTLDSNDKDYKRLLADLFITKFPDLADKSIFGAPQLKTPNSEDFYTVAQSKLSLIIPPDEHFLYDLSVARAKTVASYLIGKEINVNRIFLLNAKVIEESKDNTITTSLSLTTD